MPTSMQKLIMTSLEDRLETDGYMVVVEYTAASNVGIIRAVPEGQYTSQYPLHFDFQSGYSTFKYTAERGMPVRNNTSFYLNYNKGEENFTITLENIIMFLEGKWKTT